MSQLPFGHGQYGQYGHPFQSLPNQHLPVDHGSALQTWPSEDHRAALQGAFEYNSSRIPGLGAGAPGPENMQYVPQGIGSWAQYPPFAPSVSAMDQMSQYRPPANIVTAPTRPSVSSAPVAAQPPTQARVTEDEVEDGELSEGQFEDLYSPRQVEIPPTAARPADSSVPPRVHAKADQDVMADESSEEGGLYGNDEEGGLAAESRTGQPGGDDQVHKQDSTRTGSYSPCLSERETGSHANTPRRAQDAPQLRTFTTYAASTAQQSSLVESKPPAPVTRAFPGLQHIKQQPEKPSLTDPGPPAAGKTQSNGAPAQTRPFKSLQEAKKEAQKAILRLWPLGVRYQTYIDEGFDEYFIRSLFADLHLEMPQTAKDASEQIRAQPATKAGQNKNSPTSPQNALSSTSSHVNMPEAAAVEAQKAVTMSDKSGKAEERKDRIARLLAQKTAKPPAPSQQATAVQVSSAPAASSVKPAKVWGEKELLIQKKMEELKKNRGAQNSRSAGAAVQPQAQAPVADGVDQATRNAKADAVVQLLAGGPGSEPVRPSASRKRPVAADFADYSSTTNPPKRAHHQEQQESRLMTDVGEPSDGEEMDLDTSTPPSVAPTQRLDTSHRPARDFAPLTDTGSRTVSFPANGKNTQLERKEKELQEMKRKLAEALAKKQTKRNGTRPGSQTPQPEGAAAVNGLRSESPGTPLQRLRSSSGPSDGPSAQLFAEATASLDVPKPSRRGQLAPDMASRRMRIVSLDLPQVDSHLSAKVARLKELQEEIMSIQTEVDMCLSKKSRLAQELEQIDSSAAEEPPISNDDLSSVAKQHSDAPTNHAPFGVVGAEAKEGSSHPIDLAPSQLQDNTVDGSPANPIQEPAQKTDGQDKVRCTSTDAEVTGNVDEVTFRPDGAEDSRPSADDADSTEDNVPMDDSVSSDGEASANESESPEDDVPMDETKSSEGDAPMDDAESASASDEAADTTQLCMPDAATLAEAPVPTASTDGQANDASVSGRPLLGNDAASADEVLTFTPYETPLKYFRAFRFHPQYMDSVAGGLKSLTYSNQIRPEQPICPHELSGQPCPENCAYQHLRTIGVPDDMILMGLGKSDEFSGERKNRFIMGLREVLQHFRNNRVRDFATIARGILDYRARFLGDKTRILPLEGLDI